MEFVKPLDPYTLNEVNEDYRDRSDGVKGHAIQARAISDPMKEIAEVIDFYLGDGSYGSAQDSGDLQQLRKAIQQAVGDTSGDGSSGDGSSSADLSMLQNNLIYPEIETATATFAITDNSNGTLTLSAGQTWLRRGLFRHTTSDYDLADRTVTTVANKAYHLRWTVAGGFVLKALDDIAYNPSSLSETSSTFDTAYDDMLVALIETDGSNSPTITPLKNKHKLGFHGYSGGPATIYTTGSGSDGVYREADFNPNWARTPIATFEGYVGQQAAGPTLNGYVNKITYSVARNLIHTHISSDWNGSGLSGTYAGLHVVGFA